MLSGIRDGCYDSRDGRIRIVNRILLIMVHLSMIHAMVLGKVPDGHSGHRRSRFTVVLMIMTSIVHLIT
jgi:hypothetical protein